MKNLLKNLLIKVGLMNDCGGPAHAGENSVYFTNVYRNENGVWVFSWRSADHSKGAVTECADEQLARDARDAWISTTKHSSFVNE